MSGNQDHRAIRVRPLQLSDQLEAGHLRHDHVGDDQLRSQPVGELDGFPCMSREDDIESPFSETHLKDVPHGIVVIDHQNFQLPLGHQTFIRSKELSSGRSSVASSVAWARFGFTDL